MGARHMCTRVYFIYIYIYSYYYYNARHQQQLSICFATLFAILCRDICNIFRFALVVSCQHYTTLHYAVATLASRLHYTTCWWLTTLHYATLRLQPFAAVAYYLIYIYSVQLLNTYLNLKRSTDRLQPFHAICLRFNGLYRGRAPYLPPKPIALPSKIIIYISEKIFFEKK